MGRRARTNCSPVDTAMEKYHSDIGNRLSGAVVQQPHCNDEGTTDVFAMLTLDLRRGNSIKKTNTKAEATDLDKPTDGYCTCDNNSSNASSEVLSHNTCTERDCRMCCAVSLQSQDDQAFAVKEKKSIMDKLARALFQRKHTCARCQRKSKSCLPNKNFTGTEGHYMCGRCRETCHVIKNLVSGQCSCPHDQQLAHTTEMVKPKPRLHLNDSGYDTVTSCSTVASSFSASTGKSGHNCPAMQTEDKDNMDASSLAGQDSVPRPYCGQSALPNPQECQFYMGVAMPVKTRNALNNYDGYLQGNGCENSTTNVCQVRPPLSDATNSSGSECDCPQGHDSVQSESAKAEKSKPIKACYTCGATNKPSFHLPWEGGWLCEDCLDGLY